MAIIYTYPTKATPVDADLILISDSADSNKTKQVTVASVKGQTAGVTSIIAGTNVTISSTGASGTGNVTINASGGGGAVDSINTTDGTYVDLTPNTATTGPVTVTADLSAIDGTSDTSTRFLSKDNTWDVPSYTTNTTDITLTTANTSGASTWDGTTLNIPQYSGGGISFSGTTVNGIATYYNSTTATVSSAFTVSGNKLSAPAGTLADPSIEVGAIGGLYAASGGILLAHNGANAIGVTSSSTVNYKLTQFNAGLKFGATGETLSSYEEGTWTPTSANANSISSATGDYTRIGDMVFAQFSFTMTGSTSIAIASLPFQGVYTSSLKGGAIISKNTCLSVQGQIVGGQFTGANTFTFNAYFGSGSYNPLDPSVAALPLSLYTTTSSLYQTSGGTYAGTIIYETTA